MGSAWIEWGHSFKLLCKSMVYSLLSNKYSNGHISEVMLFQVGRRANLQVTVSYCTISWLLHVSTTSLGHTLFSIQSHVGCTGWTDAFNQFYKPYNFPVPRKRPAPAQQIQAAGRPWALPIAAAAHLHIHGGLFLGVEGTVGSAPFILLLTKMNLAQQLVTQATKIFPFHMLGKQHLKGWFCITLALLSADTTGCMCYWMHACLSVT